MRYGKIFLVIALLGSGVVLFTQCIAKKSGQGNDPRGERYAGSASCASCHGDMSKSYAHNNHFKTSSAVSDSGLKNFVTTANHAFYFPDSQVVTVEQRVSDYYQSYTKDGRVIRSEKLEFAVGSAEKAQTYAYWKNNKLFQLPLTYFAGMQSWTNSPGYPIRQPYYDRVILSRCLECHASYVTKKEVEAGPLEVTEELDARSIIFGVDCERCHGPAAEHVEFHQENRDVKQAKFITSIKGLSRQQQLDLCGSCHSGNDLDVQRSLFGFQPGDTLENFYFPHFGSGKPDPDVHGKQMQLLRASKCFQQSKMTCGSCHSTHEAKGGSRELFVNKCMTCHESSAHAMELRTAVKSCMDCHMPLQVSKSLDFNNGKEQKSISYMLRTHRIAVYAGDDK